MGIRGEKKKVKKAYEKPKPKPKKGQERECFLFGKYMEVLGEWLTCREQVSSAAFPHVLPYASIPFGCS